MSAFAGERNSGGPPFARPDGTGVVATQAVRAARAGVSNRLLPVLLLTLAACGRDGVLESEDYGNLLNSPQGLVLVREEHPTGWGRPDCFGCHEMRNMHTVNRTGLADCGELGRAPEVPPENCVDLAEIRSIIRTRGEASCALCHGENGVER